MKLKYFVIHSPVKSSRVFNSGRALRGAGGWLLIIADPPRAFMLLWVLKPHTAGQGSRLLLPTLGNTIWFSGWMQLFTSPFSFLGPTSAIDVIGQKKAKLFLVSSRKEVYGQFAHFTDSSLPSPPSG